MTQYHDGLVADGPAKDQRRAAETNLFNVAHCPGLPSLMAGPGSAPTNLAYETYTYEWNDRSKCWHLTFESSRRWAKSNYKHIPEADRNSDQDLINELKRRGYSVVRSDQVTELTCEAFVEEGKLAYAREDLAQAIQGTLVNQIAYELFNVSPVRVTKEHGTGARPPGETHSIHLVFIKPKEKTHGEEGKASTQGEGAGQKEDQQPR